jgi:uncharacterized protein YndB with AHSA1/START domain
MKTNKNLSAQWSVLIQASATSIWQVLTDPAEIKVYLFGSNVQTDWHVGSPLTFSRDRLHPKAALAPELIIDRGRVLTVEKNKLLRFTYFSSQEGYGDLQENYSVITYTIEKNAGAGCKLSYLREKIPLEFEQANQQKFLPGMLEQIKKRAEEIENAVRNTSP